MINPWKNVSVPPPKDIIHDFVKQNHYKCLVMVGYCNSESKSHIFAALDRLNKYQKLVSKDDYKYSFLTSADSFASRKIQYKSPSYSTLYILTSEYASNDPMRYKSLIRTVATADFPFRKNKRLIIFMTHKNFQSDFTFLKHFIPENRLQVLSV